MPIQPNTDVYMPDPLVGPRAASVGFDIGKQSSPFANFVQGAFQGAKDTVQIADTLQQMEFRPQEQARADREQQSMEEYRRINNEQQNQRLEFDKYKFQQEYDLQKQQEARLRTTAAISQGNQAMQTMADGAIASAIVGSDTAPLEAAVRSGNTRLQMGILDNLVKDPDRMMAVSGMINERRQNGTITPELDRFGQNLEYSKTLYDANKAAGQSYGEVQKMVGVPIAKGSIIDMEPASTGKKDAKGDDIFDDTKKNIVRITPDGRKETIGVWLDNDPKETATLYRHLAAIANDTRAIVNMQKSIQQASKNRGQQQGQPNTSEQVQERPNKFGPQSRTNLAESTLPTVPESVSKIDEQRRKERNAAPTQKQEAAKNRLRSAANPAYVPEPKRGVNWATEEPGSGTRDPGRETGNIFD